MMAPKVSEPIGTATEKWVAHIRLAVEIIWIVIGFGIDSDFHQISGFHAVAQVFIAFDAQCAGATLSSTPGVGGFFGVGFGSGDHGVVRLVDPAIQGGISKTDSKRKQRCYCNEGFLTIINNSCYYSLTFKNIDCFRI